MKTSVEKLAERLKNDLGIDIDVNSFRRVYPGFWQRMSGAWSWAVTEKGRSPQSLGSQFPVSVIVKAKTISQYIDAGDTHIFPN